MISLSLGQKNNLEAVLFSSSSREMPFGCSKIKSQPERDHLAPSPEQTLCRPEFLVFRLQKRQCPTNRADSYFPKQHPKEFTLMAVGLASRRGGPSPLVRLLGVAFPFGHPGRNAGARHARRLCAPLCLLCFSFENPGWWGALGGGTRLRFLF